MSALSTLRWIIGAPALVACCFVTTHAQAPARGSGPFAIVPPIRVIEADTLEVEIEGQRVGVALAGLVAPAGNTACGRAAIAAAEALVLDGVEVHEDLALPEVTKHVPFKKGVENSQKLRIYRVMMPDGRSLAEQLALAGYGWPDPAASRALEYPVIVAAATEARAYERGCAWRASMQP